MNLSSEFFICNYKEILTITAYFLVENL